VRCGAVRCGAVRAEVEVLASGVSTREIQNVKPGSPGVSRFNVSRYWQEAGDKFVGEFRKRDISQQNLVGLKVDGIRLSKVVALGITSEG